MHFPKEECDPKRHCRRFQVYEEQYYTNLGDCQLQAPVLALACHGPSDGLPSMGYLDGALKDLFWSGIRKIH